MSKFMKTKELADYLKTTPRHIRRFIERREIPITKLGRSNRFVVSEIDEWLKLGADKVATEKIIIKRRENR